MYVGAKDPADTVTLVGEPNISLTVPGGTHGDIATAAVAVNAIPQSWRRWPGCARRENCRLGISRRMPRRKNSHYTQRRAGQRQSTV